MKEKFKRPLFMTAAVLALGLALASASGASAFAADHLYDITDLSVVVEDGSTANTVRVLNGNNGNVLQDNIDPSSDRIVIRGTTDHNRIEVKTTRFTVIELQGVTINVSADDNACAFSLIPGANVRLIVNEGEYFDDDGHSFFRGISLLNSGIRRAGLEVPAGASGLSSCASLEILDANHPKNTFQLTATSASHGAGIGGASGENAGSVLVRSATVKAYSGGYGAGIGGGFGGAGGRFVMDGGDVDTGSSNSARVGQGAGIGGGYNGVGGTVVIVSRAPAGYPKLTAFSSRNGEGEGAGLGGGANANGGIVAINCHEDLKANGGGISVYSSANATGRGAGIGGGFRGAGGTTVITDYNGSITAASSSGAPGIAGAPGNGADIGAGYGNGSHGNQLVLTQSAAGDRVVGNVVLPDTVLQYNVGKAGLPDTVLEYRIASADKLIVPAGASLRVSVNTTLINKGEIENYGTIYNDWRFDNGNGTIRNKAVFYTGGQLFIAGTYIGEHPRPSGTASSVPAPSNPAWPSLPIPSYSQLPAADRSAWVEYSISGTTATLRLTQSKTAEIVSASEDGTADIDLSELDGVTEAAFPRQALIDFANKGLDVEFIMPRGTVRLSREAARDIAGQGNDTRLYLRFRPVQMQTLSALYRAALWDGDVVYELSATVGARSVGSFNGEVTVILPYAGGLSAGAWYLNEHGRRETMASAYESGSLHLTLHYFSLFVIGRADAPATGGGTPWYYVR
ncbi:MAG: hypothetical protein LBB57_07105, partial [Clostridiales Family XIII bacterium]|jgi:hypothetical protein|nr:hypothetical protein [Clostridiales Family XIII bacterium]